LEYFTSDDCPSPPDATPAQCVATTGFGQTGVHLADTRNFRTGLDFYINKAQNHFMVEFALNRGQSAFGPRALPPPTPATCRSSPPASRR